MENAGYGNRITDNALSADNGADLIKHGLAHIKAEYGWTPLREEAVFSGVYYDSAKVGSYIIKVRNGSSETAMLKLQLRPLPYDEGFIVRHVEQHNKSPKIRTPKIISDLPWSKELGFGYLLFEDISDLPDIWEHEVTSDKDRRLHKRFLSEFFRNVLPIEPWFEKPAAELRDEYIRAFNHFEEIAQRSSHHHIDNKAVLDCKKAYLEIVSKTKFEDTAFTHGHLSGKDVKYDAANDCFIVMANLYWSYRPKYYELTFPIWVDVMHVRDRALSLADVISRIDAWSEQWHEGLFAADPTRTAQYWFNLLERAMLTIMLDLGASEWKEEEEEEKQALLKVWEELFWWIVEKKF